MRSAPLVVPAPLLLRQIEPVGCRQSAVGPLSAPQVGESVQFQQFTPDAQVTVLLSRREAKLQMASGTAVVLGEREISARVRAEMWPLGPANSAARRTAGSRRGP